MFDKLEALEMQCEYVRELLDSHAPRRLRVRSAHVAVKFVPVTERLRFGELAQTRRDGRIVRYFEAQIQEILVASRHRLAAETPRLVYRGALENVMDPRRGLRIRIIDVPGVLCGASSTYVRRRGRCGARGRGQRRDIGGGTPTRARLVIIHCSIVRIRRR